MRNRPKRRKSNNNPYTLKITNNTYIVIFKDNLYKEHVVEVSEDVFNEMNKFELDDLKELNEFDRHTEHIKLIDEQLYEKAKDKPVSLEDETIRKASLEELKKAIDTLPEIQKRRIKKFYFEDKTQQQIADEECADIRAIQYTLNIAIKKLKKILK